MIALSDEQLNRLRSFIEGVQEDASTAPELFIAQDSWLFSEESWETTRKEAEEQLEVLNSSKDIHKKIKNLYLEALENVTRSEGWNDVEYWSARSEAFGDVLRLLES